MTAPGTDLATFERAPAIDRLLSTPEGAQTLRLIKATVAPGCSDAEVGHFLELCSVYQLDPFAREAWCAKNRDGSKLLIMIGRDGLRKIVQRNGCEMEGDVVCEKDTFAYTRLKDSEGRPYHEVSHEVGGFDRGPILGAWARVYERKTNIERGWFVAPLSEYMPENANKFSPWSKQVSVMILGAAERQAARQATPMSGLLVAGEDEVINGSAVELTAGEGDGSEPGWDGLADEQVAEIEALIEVANTLAPGSLERAVTQQQLNGRPEAVESWLVDTREMLAKRQEGGEAS